MPTETWRIGDVTITKVVENESWLPVPLFDAAAVFADSVQPVADGGLFTLIPSHGHTPGHVSVLVESKGQSAVITGDLMHFPCQIGYPGWSSIYDADGEAASLTRRVFLERFADTDTMVIGTPTGVVEVRAFGVVRVWLPTLEIAHMVVIVFSDQQPWMHSRR